MPECEDRAEERIVSDPNEMYREPISDDEKRVRSDAWETERDRARQQHDSRPFARDDRSFEFYEAAYRFGFERAHMYRGRVWDGVEKALEDEWTTEVAPDGPAWSEVKDAARDAWDRVRDNRLHG